MRAGDERVDRPPEVRPRGAPAARGGRERDEGDGDDPHVVTVSRCGRACIGDFLQR
jgi:hypothetical protein